VIGPYAIVANAQPIEAVATLRLAGFRHAWVAGQGSIAAPMRVREALLSAGRAMRALRLILIRRTLQARFGLDRFPWNGGLIHRLARVFQVFQTL
jgi:hypothetical protein